MLVQDAKSVDSGASDWNYLPDRHVLESMRTTRVGWFRAIAELIDNSLDAGATRVVVESGKRRVIVRDDGNGISDLRAALTLGGHRPAATTTLGMYGVGLKDAWLYAGDTIQVDTTHRGERSTLRIGLNDIADNWHGPAAKVQENAAASGTEIALELRKGRNLPSAEVWERLAVAFTPALEAGRQVVVVTGAGKRKPLKPAKLPARTEVVQESFEVDGKEVHIDIGVMREGQRMHDGPFWFVFGHRVLSCSSLGCGDYSGEQMAGTIRLGKGWSILRNKDGLTADDLDALGDAIFCRIEPLLKSAATITQNIENDQVAAEVRSSIGAAIQNAKREARDRGDSSGTVAPVGTPIRRRRAAKVTDKPGGVDGEAVEKRRRGIGFRFHDLGTKSIGKYDSLANTVVLNSTHPYVVNYRKDTPVINALALTVFSNWVCEHDSEGVKTAFPIHDFPECLGTLLGSVKGAKS